MYLDNDVVSATIQDLETTAMGLTPLRADIWCQFGVSDTFLHRSSQQIGRARRHLGVLHKSPLNEAVSAAEIWTRNPLGL